MLPKLNALTTNKYNTTTVSAASNDHTIITKERIFISKYMFPAIIKNIFKPIMVME